jgi:hypothetical protein
MLFCFKFHLFHKTLNLVRTIAILLLHVCAQSTISFSLNQFAYQFPDSSLDGVVYLRDVD